MPSLVVRRRVISRQDQIPLMLTKPMRDGGQLPGPGVLYVGMQSIRARRKATGQ